MIEFKVFTTDPVAKLRQKVYVIDERIRERTCKHQCRSGDDDEQQQGCRKHHVDLTQSLDTFVQSRDNRYERDRNNARNNKHFYRSGGRHAVERLLRGRRYLAPAKLYRLFERFVREQMLIPELQPRGRPPQLSEDTRRIFDGLMSVVEEYRHSL